MIKHNYILIIILSIIFSGCYEEGNIKLYKAPVKISPSLNYSVKVNGKQVFVYDTKVAFDDLDPKGELENPDIASFVNFDFSGKVKIEIITKDIITKKVIVRPLSCGIMPKIEGNKISFTLSKPCKLSVEVNDKINSNLMIFANSPFTSLTDLKDTSVLFFGPGIHEYTTVDNKEGVLKLKSNQTIFLDGGAILRARIDAENCENIKIIGRGIIDGSTLSGRWPDYLAEIMNQSKDEGRRHLVEFRNSRNIEIEGVILLDAPCFAVSLKGCTNININNLKIIGYVPNSDGIDPCNSQNVTIDDVFIRTGDDCIAIKGYNWFNNHQDTKNIFVKNSILWADRASALEIGHETGVNQISDIHFTNIDILQQSLQTMGYHAIDITGVDNAIIHNIYYNNIRVERSTRLIGLRINRSKWSVSDKLGKIENIYFKDIFVNTLPEIFLYGYDSLHNISNIEFNNLVNYCNANDTIPVMHSNKYVSNIKIQRDSLVLANFESIYPNDLKYVPVNIASSLNRSRTDFKKGDKIGWLDLGLAEENNLNEKDLTVSNDMKGLKGGLNSFGDIPFKVIDDKSKTGSVVMLSSQENLTYLADKSGEISINSKARYIFFMQTSAFERSNINSVLWNYVIKYKDQSSIIVPVRNKTDVGDWKLWSMAGWQYSIDGSRIYIMPWKNPFPAKAILSITMVSVSKFEVPILFAITLGE